MKISEILYEHFVNLITPEQRRPYADYVWELLHNTYSKYGAGLGGADLENLIITPGIWKVSRRNGKLIAGVIYRDSNGRKVRLVFHDDTREGKGELKTILTADVVHGRSWGEFSGNLEKLMIKLGGKPIPNTDAERILGQKILELDPDGFHYTREVAPGIIKQQILIGNLQ